MLQRLELLGRFDFDKLGSGIKTNVYETCVIPFLDYIEADQAEQQAFLRELHGVAEADRSGFAAYGAAALAYELFDDQTLGLPEAQPHIDAAITFKLSRGLPPIMLNSYELRRWDEWPAGWPKHPGRVGRVDYTGAVTPGGPPAVRELADLSITKLSVGPMDNNAYLLRCRRTGDQLLVDAANEADRLLALAGDAGLTAVVTTHQHRDHWGALAAVAAATGAESVAHAADAAPLPVVTRTVADGEPVRVGTCELEVIHLVGHTPGSVALLYQDPAGHPHLFTGDSLFPGGPGRTTGGDDFDALMGDLQAKVFDRLPDDTWFYPGHGNDSTLGAERPAIPEWLARRW